MPDRCLFAKLAVGALVVLAAVLDPRAAAAVPPPLVWEPFTFETFAGEEVTAELSTLEVPENRGVAASEPIVLSFVRLRSTATAPRAPIVFLAGGPGASAISSARVPSDLAVFRSLTGVADVILLDQRGTGRSDRGLICPEPEEELPSQGLFADLGELERRAVQTARRCRRTLEERGIDLAGYTTGESAADLEALRAALGVERLSLLGFSYGTHLGLAAIRDHGEQLERVALIGTEGPDHTRKLPSTLDTQVRKLSRLASADPAIGRQVPDLYGLLERVLAKLEQEPVRVPVVGPDGEKIEVAVGADGLRLILAWDLGDGHDIPVLPALLYTLDRGDPSLLGWFVRKRLPALGGAMPAMHFAMEGASGASAERRRRIEREASTAILADVVDRLYPAVADALGIAAADDALRAPIVSDVETLFLSGTLDSNTPPFQAEEVRWGFTASTHLEVENAGHEDMLGEPEITEVLVDFFSGGSVAARRLSLPPPVFLSVAEAKRHLDVE